jgi:hypothetical protein
VDVDAGGEGLVLIAEPTLRELEHLPQERNTELAGPSSGKPDREA